VLVRHIFPSVVILEAILTSTLRSALSKRTFLPKPLRSDFPNGTPMKSKQNIVRRPIAYVWPSAQSHLASSRFHSA